MTGAGSKSFTVQPLANGPLNVAVRIRGLVQPKTIFSPTSTDGLFAAGGSPDGSGADLWKLEVSNPPQIYYLNSGVSLAFNPEVPYVTSMNRLDLTKVIRIQSGATVTLSSNSNDGARS